MSSQRGSVVSTPCWAHFCASELQPARPAPVCWSDAHGAGLGLAGSAYERGHARRVQRLEKKFAWQVHARCEAHPPPPSPLPPLSTLLAWGVPELESAAFFKTYPHRLLPSPHCWPFRQRLIHARLMTLASNLLSSNTTPPSSLPSQTSTNTLPTHQPPSNPTNPTNHLTTNPVLSQWLLKWAGLLISACRAIARWQRAAPTALNRAG